ncbi:hypothetical protein ABZW11_45995 [Nonomuraea sp. NPDC004580]|uniref:hypothetical protein n=1 Tax=Nonomuraea sp. NPDC004580 TaxID=3154552 RepID=UPI0033AC4B3E
MLVRHGGDPDVPTLLLAAAVILSALIGAAWTSTTGAATVAQDPVPLPPVPGGSDDPYLEQPPDAEHNAGTALGDF